MGNLVSEIDVDYIYRVALNQGRKVSNVTCIIYPATPGVNRTVG